MESQSPWISIWVRPRATIAQIAQTEPNRSLWLLAAIYGFSSLLNLFQSASIGASLSPLAIFILALVVSPIWGYISFAIWSWVVCWVGRLFKGKGTFQTIRCAYAWSCVPFALNIPFWLIMAAVFGNQLFLNFPEGYLLGGWQLTLLFLILISKMILAIWSLVIYLNGLAEVQQYSVLRAIFNVIVAGILLLIVFTILWLVVLASIGMPVEAKKTAMQWIHEGTSIELLWRGL